VDPILDELEDRVEQIFAATQELREVAGDGKTTRQLLDSIFRNVHSLKASASSNGLDNLAHIAHRFEDLLHALRVGKAYLNVEVLRAFDEISDAMFASLRPNSSQTSSLDALSHRLQKLSEQTVRSSRLEVDEILNAVPSEIWEALSEEEKHRLGQAIGEGGSLFMLATSFDIADFDQLFQNLKDKLSEKGELISTSPKVHSEQPDKVDFRILYTRDAGLNQVEAELTAFSGVTVKEIFAEQSPVHADRQKDHPQYRSASGSPHLIRIELEDLDRLISSTHQLFRETKSCFDGLFESIPNAPGLIAKVAGIDRSFLSLASELVNLRMVPIDRVLQRAFRAGRSVAASAGKQIDFRVEGHGLRIDKSISDAIADPLIHLVRNAVDHGIESADERVRAGKGPRGVVSIEASTQQGQTRIKVRDDGRGIDPEVVWNAGKRLGLLSENQRMGFDQSLRLIFRSGFTTATSISETSGRGVGLDVVETTIEEAGGAIRVDSQPGVGSVFEIRLPVTFSLIDVVVVKGRNRYLIDAAQVARVDVPCGSTLLLDKILGQEIVDAQSPVYLKFGEEIVLQVNELTETEQVLVRTLGSRGGRWFGVAGAAEMSDGKVALLLDLPALVARYRSETL